MPLNSPLDTVDAKALKIERLIKITQMYISTPKLAKAKKTINQAKKIILETDFAGSTLDGEIKVLSGYISAANGREQTALLEFDEAITIFESPSVRFDSIFPYRVRIYKGDTLRNQGKPIEAALQYQVVMQDLKGQLDKEHPFISSAFNKWLEMRSVINQKNKDKEAIEAGVCECWPYDEMRAESVLPVRRVPPVMPSTARRSGHVIFKFDVNNAGDPQNIEVIKSTEKKFIKPALKSVKSGNMSPSRLVMIPQPAKG